MPTISENSTAAAAADNAAAVDLTTPNANSTAPTNTGVTNDADASDEDSLCTAALSREIDEDAANAPGKVEEMLTDDKEVPPKERVKMICFLAKTIGIDVHSDLDEVVKRPGDKKLLDFPVRMLIKELDRRGIKVKNKKKVKAPELWAKLPDLTDEKDVNYIRARYASTRDTLLAKIREAEAVPSVAQRKGTDVMRVYLLILKHADLRRAYALSQNASTREMLDAGETYMSRFLKLLVLYFNDSLKTAATPANPSLHSSFSEPIVCNKGNFELTEEKAKKLFADSRKHLTTMINNWERSGNGSNQKLVGDGDDEDNEFDFDTWGRFDAEAAAEHEDGDDRANFLRHLPHYWLMVWHLCDEGDLLRFTCAQLCDEHSASSDTTTTPVTHGRGASSSSARKLAQESYALQKEIAASVKDIGKAVAAFSATADKTYERASKIRRIDQLKGDRYLVFKDSQCPVSTAEEKRVAAEFVKELDERIAKIEAELEADKQASTS